MWEIFKTTISLTFTKHNLLHGYNTETAGTALLRLKETFWVESDRIKYGDKILSACTQESIQLASCLSLPQSRVFFRRIRDITQKWNLKRTYRWNTWHEALGNRQIAVDNIVSTNTVRCLNLIYVPSSRPTMYIYIFGAAAQRGLWSSHSWGCKITQRRTTFRRTTLDELSARRRDLYLTPHNIYKRHPRPRRDSNSQSQQASGPRPTPDRAASVTPTT
jgi:hypothetical protein